MGEVTALRNKDITPEIVLANVLKELSAIKQLYVVALTDGEPIVWATGNLSQMCFAAKYLDSLCLDYVNGKIEEER